MGNKFRSTLKINVVLSLDIFLLVHSHSFPTLFSNKGLFVFFFWGQKRSNSTIFARTKLWLCFLTKNMYPSHATDEYSKWGFTWSVQQAYKVLNWAFSLTSPPPPVLWWFASGFIWIKLKNHLFYQSSRLKWLWQE